MLNLDNVILKNLIFNEPYARKVLPFLEIDYFKEQYQQKIFVHIKEHLEKYSVLPKKEELLVSLSKDTNLKSNDVESIDMISEELFDSSEISTDNIQWLLDNSEQFCKDRAVENAIKQSILIINGVDKKLEKGAIPDILTKALSVTFNKDIGHDYIENADERFEYYHKIDNKVPFDIELFNTITNGGVSNKTLNLIMAGPNVGKTLLMNHMAAGMFMAGKNVLYITMEMSEEEIAKRIDANLLNISINELDKTPEVFYKQKIDFIKSKTKGRLKIHEYPTGSANVSDFKSLLYELNIKANFVPDIIFIDYLNICSSSRLKQGSTVNSYTYIKAISEEIRGLAVEFNIPILSATQTNRSGSQSSDLGMSDISESFAVNATCDLIIGVTTDENLEKMNQFLVKQIKNRYNRKTINKKFLIGVDLRIMRIYEVSQDDISETDNVVVEGEVEEKLKISEKFGSFRYKPAFNHPQFGKLGIKI